MKLKKALLLIPAAAIVVLGLIFVPDIAHLWYKKSTYMIEMRDGVKLHTTVYTPRFGNSHPIMLFRTPYGTQPYGAKMSLGLEVGYLNRFIHERYILVFQDVRGRFMSEGEFEHVRPVTSAGSEENDTYDTVEWLISNLERTNKKVGLGGCSYPGFYAMAGAVCGHGAVKAVSAQAPVTDWFMGDDVHHNGVLMLEDFFSFIAPLDLGNHTPGPEMKSKRFRLTPDEYTSLLKAKTRACLSEKMPEGAYSEIIRDHPDYDTWWQERNLAARLDSVSCPVMITGGLYDAEDLYGTWKTFRTVSRSSSAQPLFLVVGPWSHSAWKGEGTKLGDFSFGREASSRYYSKHYEMPFLNHYLKEDDSELPSPVSVFITGSNRWYTSSDWNPATETRYYLSVNRSLTQFPCGGSLSYVSDPDNPVPYVGEMKNRRGKTYMNADQRFTKDRSDVLEYQTEPFAEDTTFAGPVEIHLRTSVSTTDIDFAVRIIDCFGEESTKPGYEMLVRADVMRARYRHGFSDPIPVLPYEDFDVDFTLPDIAHTFRSGHRLKICVQSSWFPIAELSPQQFVNLWSCSKEDFIPSTVKISGTSSVTFHAFGSASKPKIAF